jgi:hypothetical protein
MQTNDGTRNVWDLFEGSWPCVTQQRIGKIGDGGKWICDPHKLRAKKKKCIIYSFGSAGESSFEEDAYENYGCEIHSFDPTLDADTQASLLKKAPKFFFHPWGIRAHGRKNKNKNFDSHDDKYKSLKDIMKILGHDYIDVLKVDIEGSEWNVFNDDLLCPSPSDDDDDDEKESTPRERASQNNKDDDVDDEIDDKIQDVFDHLHHQPGNHRETKGLTSSTTNVAAAARKKQDKGGIIIYDLPFDQLSIELHWSGGNSPDVGEKDLFEFMRGMHEFGFKRFHREGNALDIQHCWEYSFVKTDNNKGSHSMSKSTSSDSLDAFIRDCKQDFDVRHSQALKWLHAQ